jgi:subtilisin family serine protease
MVGLHLLLASAVLVATPQSDKIDPFLRAHPSAGPTEVLIVLGEQADLSGLPSTATKEERGRFVYERLREVAERSQRPVEAMLEARGIEHRPFWIVNAIWARLDPATMVEVANRPEVERVEANPHVRSKVPLADRLDAGLARAGIEWNVLQVGADAVWTLGYTGTGVVIGGQDTGYSWDHPAIRSAYRGWNGTAASHSYNWHDAIHASLGACGHDNPAPCDDDGHGTHTMGTMVGDDGVANQIGVAPGAKWIGCRNMNGDVGTPTTYTECFQWFLAPTSSSGQNPDPSKAPDVINNSWGCPPSEGCSANTLKTIIENVRAAGIVVVASAGNDGPSCGTVHEPPPIYDAAFSVGATDSSDVITQFSGRGPVVIDGSNRRKPDVSAPGLFVRSSWPGGSYTVLSGTSMAGPHVAGLVALLLDAKPELRGRVDDIETIITRSAVPHTPSQTCGGDVVGVTVPNNMYGAGRVDALDMLVDDADTDGTANLEDCAPVDAALWAAPEPVTNLRFVGPTKTSLSWTADDPGAAAPRYDVLRATSVTGFGSAVCVGSNLTTTSVTDTATPTGAFFYLLRVENGCGAAVLPGSDGLPRTLPGC